LLRGSLGITFVWFGALKLAGQPTLPASLIAAITPFLDPDLSVPLVGALEVALGVGLLLGRWLSVVLAGVALQLSGTFLVLVLRPGVAFVGGNPLLLSCDNAHRPQDAHDPAHSTGATTIPPAATQPAHPPTMSRQHQRRSPPTAHDHQINHTAREKPRLVRCASRGARSPPSPSGALPPARRARQRKRKELRLPATPAFSPPG
jgi:hypothetical protein